MERFISVECFRKKGNTFRGIPFSRFDRNARKFLYHLSTITSAREKYTVSFVFQLKQPVFLANDTAHSHFLFLSTERAVPFVETFSPKISFKW